MLKIAHRVNTIASLRATPPELGIEMDLHAYGDRLTVHHDPFVDGEDFGAWLDNYRHRLLILNIKEEGIERRVMDMAEARGIKDFFLLDVTPPMLFKLARGGESRMAVRMSACESVSNALALAGKVEWVFIDVMEEAVPLPISRKEHDDLRAAGFKLCMVSHELWGRPQAQVRAMQAALQESGVWLDAVLTKQPGWWPDASE